MTISEIAIAFSNGEFGKTYDRIAETAEWEVVGENTFSGKRAIIDNCKQVEAYFKSVTTNFKTHNVISQGNKVVVSGTGEFIRDGQRISFVSACDVYSFNESGEVERITSYCIQTD